MYFDSIEINTLNKGQALVISKYDIKQHMSTLNLDLI